MTEPEGLADSLNGMYAYDTGSVDSGIHDEALRTRCGEYLRGLDADSRRVLLGRIVRDSCVSEEALAAGYGAEDARGFADWLDEQGWLV